MSEVVTETAQATTQAAEAPQAEAVTETPNAAEQPKEAATEVKTETEVEVKAETKEEPKSDKPVAPEKYDLKLAEDTLLEPSVIDKVAAVARERGLSNEEAQSLLDQQHQEVETYIESKKQAWLKEAESDKEIGGAKLGESVERAKRFAAKFGSPAFNKMLDRTGYGNHPELIRMLSKAERSMGDDTFVHANTTGNGKKSLAERMYGKQESSES